MPIVTRAILYMLMLCPIPALAGSIEARTAYRNREYASVLREFGSDAQSGPVGNFFLALMYLRGEGVVRDERRGLKHLMISAENGYPPAQYLLGRRYFYGLGVPEDKGRAISHLKAASTEDFRASSFLQIVSKRSSGESRDQARIVATVKRRAMALDPDAQYTLAFMYLIGDGVPKNIDNEVRWYRAAAGKNPRAAFMLSLMYRVGDGVSQDHAEALRLMRIAAGKGYSRAQYYLGTYYYQGIGTKVDRISAGLWFRRSAEAGFAKAQLAYAMLLLSGDGVSQNKSQAIEWLGKASRQGNGRARDVLRELLTYHGENLSAQFIEFPGAVYKTEVQKSEDQLLIEGKGIILDQGSYGLKFSLPTLYDAYAPQNNSGTRQFWENFQGGTFSIIFRTSD